MRKKIILAIICALLLALAACGQPEEIVPEVTAEPAIYTAGTYEGVAEGYSDTVKVEVVVNDTEIVSIDLIQMNETESVAAIPVEDTIKNILEVQSVEVDAVSGATAATSAVIEAVGAALDQAKIQY